MAERGSFSSYGNSNQRASSNNDFLRLSQSIGNNIQKITSNVSQMQTLLNQVGTKSESPDIQDKIHKLQHYTNQLAKDTNKYVKDLNMLPNSPNQSEQKQQKIQKERLVNEFTKALNSLQAVQRQEKEKEKTIVQQARISANASFNPFADDDKPRYDQIQSPGYRDQQAVVQIDASDVDFEIMREREEALKKLETDISDVNQIFKDLGMLVHEQGDTIDSIEANTESAAVNVEQGVEQLHQAKNYQSSARKKKCCIVIVVLVIVAIIVIVLAVTLSPKNN